MRLKELLAGGPAGDARWERAVAASADGAPVVLHLVLEGVESGAIVRTLVKHGVPAVTEAMVRLLPPGLVARIPVSRVRAHHVLPVKADPGTLHVAMADPFDADVLGDLREITGGFVQPMAIDPVLLMRSLSRYYGLPLPAALHSTGGLPLPAATADDSRHEKEEEDVVMVEPASLDDDLAELFRDDAEPVFELTRKKSPAADVAADAPGPVTAGVPRDVSADVPRDVPASVPADDSADVADARFEAIASPLGKPDSPLARIDLQTAAPPSNEAWVAPEPTRAPAPVATDAELSRTIEGAIEAIRDAQDRDAVAGHALRYLSRAFSRALVLKVQGSRVVPWLSSGQSAQDDVGALAAGQIPATLEGVIASGRCHYGPLDALAGDAVLYGALTPPPLQAAVVPVTVGSRVVLLLYGDVYDPATIFAPRRDLLERLAVELGEAFEAIIRRKKLG